MSATYSLTSSSTDVEASRDLTCASTSGTGISPVVAGDAYDHKGRARGCGRQRGRKGSFDVFLRTGAEKNNFRRRSGSSRASRLAIPIK